MKKSILHIILFGVIFSVTNANIVSGIQGNMQNFLSMNSGSFIDVNYRQINNNSTTLYSMSFIQFPAEIQFHEFFFQKRIDKYLISSTIGVLNYGIFEDTNNREFSADEQMIRVSIFNVESSSLTYGISAGYCLSHIDIYTSSLLSYSIGLNKTYFDNRLAIGLSLEKLDNVIENFSNINDTLPSIKKVSTSYKPKFLPFNILVDYLYEDSYNSKFVIGIHGKIYNNLYLYSGKHIYFNDFDYYSVFNNFSLGLGILLNNIYKMDFGIQYLTDGVISVGISFTAIKLDNF